MTKTLDASAPAPDAPANEWISYWVKVRITCKGADFLLCRLALKEIKRLSATVKSHG